MSSDIENINPKHKHCFHKSMFYKIFKSMLRFERFLYTGIISISSFLKSFLAFSKSSVKPKENHHPLNRIVSDSRIVIQDPVAILF
jgi:hypothetical protein